jgi:Iron-sulfur cluster-binding domain
MSEVEAFCGLPFRKVKVNAYGDVNMCCYQQGFLGNLLQQDFMEIWCSPIAQEVRESTAASHLHTMCVGWGGCPFLVQERVPLKVKLDHSLPTQLELDLPNTHCNVGGSSPEPETACFMCPRASTSFTPEPDYTYELVDRLKFLMPYLADLRIQGVAEPFWKDRVFDVLERFDFQEHNKRCIFSTYTNGTVFNEERQWRFFELCPKSALFFSLDAATPDTYRKIRRLNAFDRVVQNIRRLTRQKGQNQRVEVSNNLNLLNLHEAVQMVELGKELCVDRIQFNPTHEGGGRREDLDSVRVNRANYQDFAEAQKLITQRASQLGVAITIVRPLDMGFSATPLDQVPLVGPLYRIRPHVAPPVRDLCDTKAVLASPNCKRPADLLP